METLVLAETRAPMVPMATTAETVTIHPHVRPIMSADPEARQASTGAEAAVVEAAQPAVSTVRPGPAPPEVPEEARE